MTWTARRALESTSHSQSLGSSDILRPGGPHRTARRFRVATFILFAIAAAGCNSEPAGPQTSAPAPAKSAASSDAVHGSDFEVNRKFQTLPVSRFAGRVTIDGQAPKEGTRLFVILTDPKHLDENGHGALPKLFATCDAQGNFAFGTYDLKNKNDGVVAGNYVVTFVNLHKYVPPAKKGRSNSSGGSSAERRRAVQYASPDDLKNLYNDPDKNVKDGRFNLNLVPPGRDDYRFDLAVAGKAPAKPAPNAVRFMTLRD